jgi:hypothetical protein
MTTMMLEAADNAMAAAKDALVAGNFGSDFHPARWL